VPSAFLPFVTRSFRLSLFMTSGFRLSLFVTRGFRLQAEDQWLSLTFHLKVEATRAIRGGSHKPQSHRPAEAFVTS
jgi:hypothetical protein